MADTGIFCSGEQVKRKAGEGANATAISEDYLNDFIAQAESLINVLCKYNFSDNYTDLNVDTRQILSRAASCRAAIDVINYDMSGYTSRTEAENMVNILRDAALNAESILRKKDKQDFILESSGVDRS